MSDTEASIKADHLCVLVHGLWGKPAHLDYMAAALKERYGEDHLYILCPEGNSGNFTYDGVEVGGERVVHEIEDTMQKLEAKGQKITKISVVGYSLGGLVARYAIGLLQAHGWLDKVEPMNFTTFASPHIGVRTPLKGGILADPESIFIQGLKRFQNRSVYGNIVNDRTTAFYTTLFTKTNPFRDLEKININYVEGYEQVIVDPEEFLLPLTPKEPETCASEAWHQSKTFLQNMPIYLLILLLLPPASTLFCINAAIQTFRSQKRIRLHVEGKNGALFGKYKVPLLVRDMQHVMDEVFESANARQEPAYLSSSDLEASDSHEKNTGKGIKSNSFNSDSSTDYESSQAGYVASQSPKLALTPGQFDIIDSLNDVGFRKYPVYIHKHRHSHAAIVHRIQKDSHSEGKLVMKHWLDNGFVV
ncbi:hypothetical protein N7454_000048 [Penicillium verhagenii]|nr:hypothetical protein N7454_000048 [Penicillium verhagenii]